MALDAGAPFARGHLGRTGVPVHRLGMGTLGTISTAIFEYAIELGINYFYWGWARDEGVFRETFVQAFRNQARHRDRLVVAMWYLPSQFSTTHDAVRRNLQTEYL